MSTENKQQMSNMLSLFYNNAAAFTKRDRDTNHELEVKFKPNLTKIDYKNVIQKLKSSGFTSTDEHGSYYLRAYSEFIDPNTGGVYQGNNSSSWSTTSDQRLKKNIADNNDGLDKINSIRVRNFEYRVADEVTELPKNQVIQKTGVQLGVIAQELQAVLPDCVKTESTGVMTVDSDNLTWYMINAIKELKAELDAYKLTHP